MANAKLSKCFPFRKLAHNKVGLGGNHISTLIYSFKSDSGNKYLFHADYHRYNLYAVKFYHRNYKTNPNKYNVTTNLGEARGIFNTCMYIMNDIYRKDQLASFCLIAGPTAREIDIEVEKYIKKKKDKQILNIEELREQISKNGIENVKRYRVYKQYMKNFFPQKKWKHHQNDKNNIYLVQNKKNVAIVNKETVFEMLVETYENLTF